MTRVLRPVDPDLALLTGDGAGELLDAALSAPGATVLRWRARQVEHRPGVGTVVGYVVQARWPDGAETEELLGACAGDVPAGTTRVTDGRAEVGLWRWPLDPDLPALPAACDAGYLSAVLGRIGLATEHITTTVRVYRPRRRAVLQVNSEHGSVFVKVVRPSVVGRLYELHSAAHASGCPVPAVLGWTDDGLIVFAGLAGNTLRDELVRGRGGDLDPGEIVAVLDGLPRAAATGERAPTWGQRAPRNAAVVGAIAPDLAARAEAIARAVDHERPEGPDRPIHGDFHEKQLLVADGRITGLLDLDTVGRGERIDDAGCLLAHLSVLSQLCPAQANEIDRLGAGLRERFAADLAPAATARRAAAVALALAVGPHRVQKPGWHSATERRIELAERWLLHGAVEWPEAGEMTKSSSSLAGSSHLRRAT